MAAWAAAGSFQKAGSWAWISSSAMRFSLFGTSKALQKRLDAQVDFGEAGDKVFHKWFR
jgi:hypothetical protein